jgi:hypothetical protein
MIGGKVFARLLGWLRGQSSKPPGEVDVGRTGRSAERVEKIDPVGADLLPDDLDLLPVILDRLASLKITSLNLLAGETCEPADFISAIKLAAERGFRITVRGRATELAKLDLQDDLATADIEQVECLFLSPVDEIHDALAGAGDCRLAKSLLERSRFRLPCMALVPLVPVTLEVLDRTIEYLIENKVPSASLVAIVSAADEPSSWALPVDALIAIANRLMERKFHQITFGWYPPLKFDRGRTLAQQIRQGPRCGAFSVRVTCDGSLYQPVGSWKSSGNLLESEADFPKVYRAVKRECLVCPCQKYCVVGCLREASSWA